MRKILFRRKDKFDFRVKEAFNTLRTNIIFSGKDMKVLSLTSSAPNEGKSVISFQLASSFAAADKRVLFVDADVRKSDISTRYKIEGAAYGLTHYMTGQKTLEEVICRTDIENMDIILAGPVTPKPTELLGGPLFSRLLEEQRENYDYIIIDAPPLGSVIDAAIIARYADGSIIVVESGVISYKILQRVKGQLEKSECRILGVVLNKENTKHGINNKKYYKNPY